MLKVEDFVSARPALWKSGSMSSGEAAQDRLRGDWKGPEERGEVVLGGLEGATVSG